MSSNFVFSKPLNKVVIYPAPKGEALNTAYYVSVAGRSVSVYNAKIGAADNNKRFKAVDDLLNSDKYYDTAAFAYFDMRGSAMVNIKIRGLINSVKILPTSSGIKAIKNRNGISFIVAKSQNLTIEINGETVRSLHLFINPIEDDKPDPHDPNVIFFGPGIHMVSCMTIGSNKTVYVAGGAIVRAVIGENEKYGIEPSGLKNYSPRFFLNGTHIKFIGRGIIDATACPTHAGNFIMIKGVGVTIEGVILRNSCGWTIPVRQSENVVIDNVKILGYRANSDGIDICNSVNVDVKKCFIRTNDDLIVIKTEKSEGIAKHIVIRDCVLYNETANALSLGAELRENVSDVLFSDCDIIHDQGRAWSLRIFQGDSSVVNNIRFYNLRIEEAHQFISLWIGHDLSSYDRNSGKIENIIFNNIKAKGTPLNIDLTGIDIYHSITNILFQKVLINQKSLVKDDVKNNPFVYNIKIVP